MIVKSSRRIVESSNCHPAGDAAEAPVRGEPLVPLPVSVAGLVAAARPGEASVLASVETSVLRRRRGRAHQHCQHQGPGHGSGGSTLGLKLLKIQIKR